MMRHLSQPIIRQPISELSTKQIRDICEAIRKAPSRHSNYERTLLNALRAELKKRTFTKGN